MDIYRELFLMQQTYGTLFSLANKIQVKGDKFLELLTSRQYMAMVAIAHLPEDETTLNNIARKLGTTKQSAKQLITIMENKGYVNVVPSKKDKRAINVKITKTGKEVLLVVAEKGIFFLEELFKKLSTEELEIMWDLLKKLYSFDGEEHDGFEEEGNLQMDEDNIELQLRVMKEFEVRRIQAINKGNKM
ncbi:MarR family winged helix-turn-helix transcriptional regulator [Bacillus pseudomycoides]|uniref:MarR family winged helix-turn-helix transcriptional regulator n=1 Tax=Bacillus pseudomycoides TaxID=64104 RepID=UPI000BFD68B7|nr:MarR family transcriptional regulator [Bacillus pseudomycoides]PHA78852.1 MarR family transcriptional regulator [Bacillus pseudomycoides]PHC68093.1 MarR family transcriptional regulator [Bacillus pseudomycoides]